MIKHHKDAVFSLAQGLSSLDVYSVVLFGSVAKGTSTEESDIDILVLLNTEISPTKEEEEEVFKIVFGVESKFNVHIEIIISNKNLIKLDKFFVQHVLNEGVVLYAKTPEIKIQDLALKPYVLISFFEKKLKQSKKMLFRRALYCYQSYKIIGKKKYISKSEGLLIKIHGIKVRSGVVLISSSHLDKLLSFLDKFRLPHYEHDLWMHA